MDTNQGGSVTSELHVHDWTPWGPSMVNANAGVTWRRRTCRGCYMTQDEPTPDATPSGLVPESAIEAAAKTLYAEDANYGNSAAEFSYTDEDWAAQDEGNREAYRESARRAVAAAVPHIERTIRDKTAAAEALHAPKRLHPEFRFRPWCEECSTGERTFHDDGVFTHRVYWPCRTAQALGMVDPLDPARVARGGEATP